MIDLGAKEIEEYSDATNGPPCFFVYENDGGGLSFDKGSAAATETISCFCNTTADAKGNSIKSLS